MEIKDILKEERKKRKLTQEQLAKEIKIARPAYAMYETGKNTPPTDVLIRIADFYNVSTDYLLGRYTKKRDKEQ